jgi:hypothetical protein
VLLRMTVCVTQPTCMLFKAQHVCRLAADIANVCVLSASVCSCCPHPTKPASGNSDGTFVFSLDFVCDRPATGWPAGGFSVTMTATAIDAAGWCTTAACRMVLGSCTSAVMCGVLPHAQQCCRLLHCCYCRCCAPAHSRLQQLRVWHRCCVGPHPDSFGDRARHSVCLQQRGCFAAVLHRQLIHPS